MNRSEPGKSGSKGPQWLQVDGKAGYTSVLKLPWRDVPLG
jgi:hypothetical protein